MLSIQSFEDGGRLVVVIEGLNGVQKDDIVKNFLSSLTCNAETLPQVDAEPVAPKEVPKIDQGILLVGPYEGLTPDQALKQGKTKAFRYLSSCLDSDEFEDIKSSINDSLTKYLKNFNGCDAVQYANKLSSEQVTAFCQTYQRFFPEEAKSLVDGDENSKRKAVRLAITAFQKN